MKLTKTTFGSVRLGSVFFDPSSGHKYQKVDEPNRLGNKYGSTNNAVGNSAQSNFEASDPVKVHESAIKTKKG